MRSSSISVEVSFRLLLSVVSKGLTEREFLVVWLEEYFGDLKRVCS